MSELARALAFEAALDERCAERIVPFRFGAALFNDTFARVWDLNRLRVDEPERATAEELAAEAERLHAAAGHAHRRIALDDDAHGVRLAPGLRAAGWVWERLLLMAHPGERPASGGHAVVEVERAALVPLREHVARSEPWAEDDGVVQEVIGAGALVSAAGSGRHFAALAEGAVVSGADLYSDGRTAQIEQVITHPEHRRRGFAAAVVLHAQAAAREEGHDLVFLVVDDVEGPKGLYARLGFEPLGRRHAFLKTTPRARPRAADES